MIKSINESDLPLFSEECYKFNEIIPFDKWKTAVLTRIKSRIPENKEGESIAPGNYGNYEQNSNKPAPNDEEDEL